jgi:ribosomal protein S9
MLGEATVDEEVGTHGGDGKATENGGADRNIARGLLDAKPSLDTKLPDKNVLTRDFPKSQHLAVSIS